MKSLKNVEGKNEEQVKAIKDQINRQLRVIKNQGEKQLKTIKNKKRLLKAVKKEEKSGKTTQLKNIINDLFIYTDVKM